MTGQLGSNPFNPQTAKRVAATVGLLFGVIGIIGLPSRLEARPVAGGAPRPTRVEQMRPSAPVFVENRGQWADSSVRFALNGAGVNVGVTDTGLRFRAIRAEPSPHLNDAEASDAPEPDVPRTGPSGGERPPVRLSEFSVQFLGARRVTPEGEAKARPVFHFQHGAPGTWREDVPSWKTVIYRGLYEGIDLRIRCKDGTLRYEFVVAPGADWTPVRLRYDGVERIHSAEDGVSELRPGDGWQALFERAPVIRQKGSGQPSELAVRFAPMGVQTAAVAISGKPDPAQSLVIEGALDWSTALGGTADDSANGIAVDALGNILVTGKTSSFGWITGSSAWMAGGGTDAFVVKLDPDGELIWSRYLGGTEFDAGGDIVTDSANNVLVTGTTSSDGWVLGGYETVKGFPNIWVEDPFVVKLGPDGRHQWSTYLGGGDFHNGVGIAVDKADNVLVTGNTLYRGWAVSQVTDAFVIKLSKTGWKLWSARLGDYNAYPSYPDEGSSITADSQGNVLVAGYTYSSAWLRGGPDITYNGGGDAFVAKFTPDGRHAWATYLGGASKDAARAIAVDGADHVFVAGATSSRGWLSGGFDTLFNGAEDGFVTKLKPDGAIVWSTYLGGLASDGVRGLACDRAGNVYAVGSTASTGWIRGGSDTSYHGSGDAFVLALDSAGKDLWSTYLGGPAKDYCNDIALDGAGNLLVAGNTWSKGWTTATFQTNLLRGGNAFVARLRAPSGNAGCSLATPEPRVPRQGNVGTTTPTLWWADVSDEAGYVVNLYAGSSATGALLHTSVVLPPDTISYSLPDSAGLQDKQTNSWQVKAVGDGVMTCDSGWSRLFTFTVKTNLAADTKRPTVRFTSPQPHGRAYNPVITVWGQASDNRAVAEVRFRINDGAWVQANGTATWNADVGLQPGSNVVQAFSVDGSGLYSATNRLPVFSVVPSPLTLITNGEGSIARQFKGTMLEIGRTYQVRAVPKTGQVFSHWSGSLSSTNTLLRFIMESNLVVVANFIPNPFAPTKGLYQGLFFAEAGAGAVGDPAERTAPVDAASSGSFTLALTGHGAASGVIVLAGQRHPFSGMRFDRNGSSRAQLEREKPRSPLTMDLQLDRANGAGTLRGRISGDGWESGLLAFRTGPRSTHSGRYTFVLSGRAEDDATAPAGGGAGVITVAANGSLRWAGRLADGTAISRGGGHSEHGWWALHVPLQAGRGVMFGWAQFTSNAGSYDVLGTNLWLKAPSASPARCYPCGFAVMRELWGARYQVPAPGQRVVDWTRGRMTFAGGNLPTPLITDVTWADNQLVMVENHGGVNVRVNVSNGLFNGALLHPATGGMTRFKGALLQRPGWGAGWFLGTDQAGSMGIDPANQ